MKHISAYLTSQPPIARKPNQTDFWLTDSEPVIQVRENPEKFFQALLKYERDIFDYLSKLSNSFMTVFPSYATIAEEVNVCETTVKKALKKLIALGLIAKNYIHRRSCRYVVSSWFKNLNIRLRLSNWITAFKWLPLDNLIPFRNCPHLKPRNVCLCELCLPYIIDIKSISKLSCPTVIERLTLAYKKGRRSMEYVMYNPISEQIRNIKSLKLSKWGQIRLMAFPNKAIEYADDKMKYSTIASLRDPFRFFTSLCVDWCKREEIQPNWEIVYQLEIAYKPPENPPYLLKGVETVTQVKQSHQGERRSDISTKRQAPSALMNKLDHWLEVINGRTIGSKERAEARAQASICRHLLSAQGKPVPPNQTNLSHLPQVRDNPVLPDIDFLSDLRGDHEAISEVPNPLGARSVEETRNELPQTDILRPTETRQVDIWDRVNTPAWRGT